MTLSKALVSISVSLWLAEWLQALLWQVATGLMSHCYTCRLAGVLVAHRSCTAYEGKITVFVIASSTAFCLEKTKGLTGCNIC